MKATDWIAKMFAAAVVFGAVVGVEPTFAQGFGAPPPPAPHGAPGPIAGAGLPILAVGYGAYWLVRRLRRK